MAEVVDLSGVIEGKLARLREHEEAAAAIRAEIKAARQQLSLRGVARAKKTTGAKRGRRPRAAVPPLAVSGESREEFERDRMGETGDRLSLATDN